MRVLVACEFSGVVRDAFRARGHNAFSCDLEPPERPGPHFQCDVRRGQWQSSGDRKQMNEIVSKAGYEFTILEWLTLDSISDALELCARVTVIRKAPDDRLVRVLDLGELNWRIKLFNLNGSLD